MTLDVQVSLLRRRDTGATVGLSFVSQGQTEAELFCATLPGLLARGKATLQIVGPTVIAHHPEWGDLRKDIPLPDADQIRSLLTDGKTPFAFGSGAEMTFSPGFRIMPRDCKDIVELASVPGK